jgi:serine/threonine protein kinase
VKRFERSSQSDHEDFESEHQNLKLFKQCLDKHPNIMLSLTTFAHGTQFIIISPLADLDLHEFFEGKHGDIEKRRKDFTPKALLEEAKCLASALNFLHYGLQTQNRQLACAHLDLKPENILVQWCSSYTHPVGCWKIHDFGTSRIKDSSTEVLGLGHRDLLAPGDFLRQFSLTTSRQFSLTTPRRPPGTFQAPEVQSSQERVVGRESDMWSFGCILAFILAFATGGRDNVQMLLKSLYRRDSTGMKNDFFYTIQEADTIVKPTIKAWLEDLHPDNDQERLWVSKTLKLIFDLLKVHPNERLKANEVCDTLKKICLEGGFQFEEPCPWQVTRAESFSFGPSHANALLSHSDNGTPTSPLTTEETIQSSTSSVASQILTLTDGISFTKLKTPGKTFKTAMCSASCHIVFLSKSSATIHSIADQTTWAPKSQKLAPLSSTASSIACPSGRDWNYISISGNYIVLRSQEQRGEREKVRCLFLKSIVVQSPKHS